MKCLPCVVALAFVLAGCSKAVRNDVVPADPISRFVAGFTNYIGSIPYADSGVASSQSAADALSAISAHGDLKPRGITNFRVVEIRVVQPDDPTLARRLTNSSIALISSETGQKIIHLRKFDGEWAYHVFEVK